MQYQPASMMRNTLFALLLITILVSACSTSDPAEDEAAIRNLIDRVAQANNDGDADAWLAAWDTPFWYMPSYQEVVTNRDSLEAMTRAAFAGWSTDISIEPQDIDIQGDWAHVHSEVRGLAVSPDKADSAHIDLKQLVVYHRTDAGWRISRLMINANHWDM